MGHAFEQLKHMLLEQRHRWLVTGAAGFIGSHLVEALLKLDQDVVAIDNLSTGYRHNVNLAVRSAPPAARTHMTFFEGNVADRGMCRQALKDVEFVLHQAALGSVPRSIEHPLDSHQSNVDGFITMLEAAHAAHIERFVYASSSSVYGDSAELPKREENVGNVLSPYAATKAINELYAQTWGRVYGLECIGLRYFNVFGTRQDPQGAYAAVVPRWVEAAVSGAACTINGNGEISRDFCHVDNVVEANLLSAFAPKEAVGEVFNIAVGERTTLKQLHDMIWDAAVAQGRTACRVPPIFTEPRRGDIAHSLADISKARRLLGYEPDVRVKDGIATLVGAWQANAVGG